MSLMTFSAGPLRGALVQTHLLAPVRKAFARQVLEALAQAEPAATLARFYDNDPALRDALAVLIPDFEYPDHSHRTLAELEQRTRAQAPLEYVFTWRRRDKGAWHGKTVKAGDPLEAVALLRRHLAKLGPDVVVDHLAFEVFSVEEGMRRAENWSLLALPVPRPFELQFGSQSVPGTVSLTAA